MISMFRWFMHSLTLKHFSDTYMQMEQQKGKTLITLLFYEQSNLGLQCLPQAYLSENLGSLR